MNPGLISIGKLAKASGFSVERLRMWELRYGKPAGQRLPSGHRRYGADEVERLHLVRQALQQGGRPREVVALDRDSLLERLERNGKGQLPIVEPSHSLPWSPRAWVRAARHMDEGYLDRQFYESWMDLGSLRFLSERAQPFIRALGEEWQKGELCVAEEHFGSEKLGDFLSGIWRRLNEHNSQGPVLLTTLPQDSHRLGLQMGALICAMAGLKVIYLGPSTPLEELPKAVERSGAKALLYSVALGTPEVPARMQLKQLARQLPKGVLLGVGGAGAPRPAPGEEPEWLRFGDPDTAYRWARAWRNGQTILQPEQAA
jgi:methylmalonyl-CoA mutase cobalamin-binding subunit